MEHEQFFSILNTILIFLFVISLTWKKLRTRTNIPKLPPGPWKLPVIGNLHQVVGSMPHIRITELAKKYGPIMHLQLGELSTIVISSAEAAKDVLTTHDLAFADRHLNVAVSTIAYGPTDIGFSKYGEYWRQIRKICVVELFSSKRVQSFKKIREQEAWSLVKSIESNIGLPINLNKMIFALSAKITFRAAFGSLSKQEDSFIPLTNKIIKVWGGFSVADAFPSIKLLLTLSGKKSTIMKLHKETDKMLDNIIKEHRVRNSSVTSSLQNDNAVDLVDVLLNLQNDGNFEFPLTDDNIKAVILDMFLGGAETISTTIMWALSEIIRNPAVMEKVQREIREVYKGEESVNETKIGELQYLKLVIKESLRLHISGPFLVPRKCREEVEICGYKIPSKSVLLVNVWALARDPKYWQEPKKFIPERFIDSPIDYKGACFEYLPFGAGRRMCPGIHYGLAVVELFIANLMYHFNWKLPNEMKPEDLDVSETFGIAVKRKNELYLIPTKYVN